MECFSASDYADIAKWPKNQLDFNFWVHPMGLVHSVKINIWTFDSFILSYKDYMLFV